MFDLAALWLSRKIISISNKSPFSQMQNEPEQGCLGMHYDNRCLSNSFNCSATDCALKQ